jgi:hypothetical protein
LIGPVEFYIDQHLYVLEMVASEALAGRWADKEDVVAVWPYEEWNTRRKRPWWYVW